MGKGENAGYQHFLLFLQCFKRPPPQIGLFGRGLMALNGILLTLSQMANFRLFRTERVCKSQFQI